jgi:hypothetical protein
MAGRSLNGTMDGRVVIEATRFWPMISAIFWLAEAALGLVLGAMGLVWIGQEDWFVVAALIGASALLAFIGVLMCGASWSVVQISGPVIVMDKSGFLDRRISDQVIPWKAMRWGIFASGRGASSLQFHADPAIGLRVKWPLRLMGRLNALFRNPPHTVLTLGTGKSVQELAGMISEFRQPRY